MEPRGWSINKGDSGMCATGPGATVMAAWGRRMRNCSARGPGDPPQSEDREQHAESNVERQFQPLERPVPVVRLVGDVDVQVEVAEADGGVAATDDAR